MEFQTKKKLTFFIVIYNQKTYNFLSKIKFNQNDILNRIMRWSPQIANCQVKKI